MKPVSLFLAGMKQIASRKFITVVKRFSSFSSDFEFDTTMLILFGLYAIICDVVGYFTGFSVYCCTRARATLLCNRVLSHYIWCHCTTRGTGRNKRRQSSIVAMKEWPLANKRRMVQQTEEDKSSVLMSLVKY